MELLLHSTEVAELVSVRGGVSSLSNKRSLFKLGDGPVVQSAGAYVTIDDGVAIRHLAARSEASSAAIVAVHEGRGIVAVCGTSPSQEGAEIALTFYSDKLDSPVSVATAGEASAYTAAAFSRDGGRFAAVGWSATKSGPSTATLFIWDVSDLAQPKLLIKGHISAVAAVSDISCVAFSPLDPSLIVTAGGKGHLCFWRLHSGFTGLKLQCEHGRWGREDPCDIASLAFLPDGSLLTGSPSGYLLLWDVGSRSLTARLGRLANSNCSNRAISTSSVCAAANGSPPTEESQDGSASVASAHDGPITFVACIDHYIPLSASSSSSASADPTATSANIVVTGGTDGLLRFWRASDVAAALASAAAGAATASGVTRGPSGNSFSARSGAGTSALSVLALPPVGEVAIPPYPRGSSSGAASEVSGAITGAVLRSIAQATAECASGDTSAVSSSVVDSTWRAVDVSGRTWEVGLRSTIGPSSSTSSINTHHPGAGLSRTSSVFVAGKPAASQPQQRPLMCVGENAAPAAVELQAVEVTSAPRIVCPSAPGGVISVYALPPLSCIGTGYATTSAASSAALGAIAVVATRDGGLEAWGDNGVICGSSSTGAAPATVSVGTSGSDGSPSSVPATITSFTRAPPCLDPTGRISAVGYSDGRLMTDCCVSGADASQPSAGTGVRDASTASGAGWLTLLSLRPHTSAVTAVAFSSDGRLLATCSNDGTAFLFEVVPPTSAAGGCGATADVSAGVAALRGQGSGTLSTSASDDAGLTVDEAQLLRAVRSAFIPVGFVDVRGAVASAVGTSIASDGAETAETSVEGSITISCSCLAWVDTDPILPSRGRILVIGASTASAGNRDAAAAVIATVPLPPPAMRGHTLYDWTPLTHEYQSVADTDGDTLAAAARTGTYRLSLPIHLSRPTVKTVPSSESAATAADSSKVEGSSAAVRGRSPSIDATSSSSHDHHARSLSGGAAARRSRRRGSSGGDGLVGASGGSFATSTAATSASFVGIAVGAAAIVRAQTIDAGCTGVVTAILPLPAHLAACAAAPPLLTSGDIGGSVSSRRPVLSHDEAVHDFSDADLTRTAASTSAYDVTASAGLLQPPLPQQQQQEEEEEVVDLRAITGVSPPLRSNSSLASAGGPGFGGLIGLTSTSNNATTTDVISTRGSNGGGKASGCPAATLPLLVSLSGAVGGGAIHLLQVPVPVSSSTPSTGPAIALVQPVRTLPLPIPQQAPVASTGGGGASSVHVTCLQLENGPSSSAAAATGSHHSPLLVAGASDGSVSVYSWVIASLPHSSSGSCGSGRGGSPQPIATGASASARAPRPGFFGPCVRMQLHTGPVTSISSQCASATASWSCSEAGASGLVPVLRLLTGSADGSLAACNVDLRRLRSAAGDLVASYPGGAPALLSLSEPEGVAHMTSEAGQTKIGADWFCPHLPPVSSATDSAAAVSILPLPRPIVSALQSITTRGSADRLSLEQSVRVAEDEQRRAEDGMLRDHRLAEVQRFRRQFEDLQAAAAACGLPPLRLIAPSTASAAPAPALSYAADTVALQSKRELVAALHQRLTSQLQQGFGEQCDAFSDGCCCIRNVASVGSSVADAGGAVMPLCVHSLRDASPAGACVSALVMVAADEFEGVEAAGAAASDSGGGNTTASGGVARVFGSSRDSIGEGQGGRPPQPLTPVNRAAVTASADATPSSSPVAAASGTGSGTNNAAAEATPSGWAAHGFGGGADGCFAARQTLRLRRKAALASLAAQKPGGGSSGDGGGAGNVSSGSIALDAHPALADAVAAIRYAAENMGDYQLKSTAAVASSPSGLSATGGAAGGRLLDAGSKECELVALQSHVRRLRSGFNSQVAQLASDRASILASLRGMKATVHAIEAEVGSGSRGRLARVLTLGGLPLPRLEEPPSRNGVSSLDLASLDSAAKAGSGPVISSVQHHLCLLGAAPVSSPATAAEASGSMPGLLTSYDVSRLLADVPLAMLSPPTPAEVAACGQLASRLAAARTALLRRAEALVNDFEARIAMLMSERVTVQYYCALAATQVEVKAQELALLRQMAARDGELSARLSKAAADKVAISAIIAAATAQQAQRKGEVEGLVALDKSLQEELEASTRLHGQVELLPQLLRAFRRRIKRAPSRGHNGGGHRAETAGGASDVAAAGGGVERRSSIVTGQTAAAAAASGQRRDSLPLLPPGLAELASCASVMITDAPAAAAGAASASAYVVTPLGGAAAGTCVSHRPGSAGAFNLQAAPSVSIAAAVKVEDPRPSAMPVGLFSPPAAAAGRNRERDEFADSDDDDEDDDDLGLWDDEDEEEDEGRPDGCDSDLWDTTQSLRAKRQAVEDGIAHANRHLAELKKGLDKATAKERAVDRELATASAEAAAFGREKQGRLNAIPSVAVLRADQLLGTTATAAAEEEAIGETEAASTASVRLRAWSSLPPSHDDRVLFVCSQLQGLRDRAVQQAAHNRALEDSFSGLTSQEAQLASRKQAAARRIAELRGQCDALQRLKFGRAVEAPQLDAAVPLSTTAIGTSGATDSSSLARRGSSGSRASTSSSSSQQPEGVRQQGAQMEEAQAKRAYLRNLVVRHTQLLQAQFQASSSSALSAAAIPTSITTTSTDRSRRNSAAADAGLGVSRSAVGGASSGRRGSGSSASVRFFHDVRLEAQAIARGTKRV